jgi:uncharacterized cupredoxin-like copper-binding protein
MTHEMGKPSRAVPKSKTVSFLYTFPDKREHLLYGCHVNGHYEAGVRGEVLVS